jgi:hypothetical protein
VTLQPTRPAPAAADTEVLFKEAHQRRRRRRLLIAAITLVAVAVSTAAVALTRSSHAQPAPAAPVAQQPAVKLPGTAPRVAWADYQGNIRIGSLQTHEQRIVASGDTDPVSTLVVSGSKIFWPVRSEIPFATIMAYDTATGHVGKFAGGSAVFKAAGSSDVFVDDGNDATLARYRVDGRLVKRFDLPKGWYLSYGTWNLSPALARGQILVQSQSALGQRQAAKPPALALWTPATGTIRPFGDSRAVVATYTGPGGADSTIAWFPASCATSNNCVLNITDLNTGTTRQVRSPLGFGFDSGGNFSPDGRQFATFAKTNSGGYNPQTRLALIDVATGSLRLVSGATIQIGEAIGWAQWIHDSGRLVVGGVCGKDESGTATPNCFQVDSRTLHTEPLRPQTTLDDDVNYSTVVLP